MPGLIEHIDAIARKNQRAVFYLEFLSQPSRQWRNYGFQDGAVRDGGQAWSDADGVRSKQCGPFADPQVMAPYPGQVYLDIPHEKSLPEYWRLRDNLEHPDGSMRHEGMRFHAVLLEYAMKNAEHDEPDYCERWAEAF